MKNANVRCVRIRLSFVLAILATALLPAAAHAQLPTGWTLRTIGSGVLAGRATYGSDTFTVEGAGRNIGGTTDQLSFVYRQITGDVTVVARVTSLENTDPWAKAGVMIRESLAGGSRNAFALVSPSRGRAFQWRSATSGTTSIVSGGSGTAPVWLRVERRGSTFTAHRSADGIAWTQIGSRTISMSSSVYVGLAVTSHAASTRATAKFTRVQVTRPLPAGWGTADIGSPSITGSASYASGAFTLRGVGTDIWGTADQFRYAYRRVSGDVDIVARVSSLRDVDRWSKAGVMVRTSMRRDAAHAFMFVSGEKGLAYQRRPATGHASVHTSGGSGTAPVWVKLERRGSAVTAFRSSDGSSWRMIDSQTLSLPSTFYVGLAVTSHDASAFATAVFTNVSVRAAQASRNTPPTVSLTAPASGATYTAPASITVSASASDADGSIARVDFYRGTTLIGRDTSAPYSVAWTNVGGGSYSLTAVAVDNAGASTRSAARTVTVNTSSSSGPLKTAVFSPSRDHATSAVTYYRVEMFTQGANPATSNPMAVRNVGKPAVVNGECRADVATTIVGLPAGYYFATVRAVGPGGSSARAVSSVFRR